MTGSVAEERIRAKVEAGFRSAYPDARIIHELVIGACRADVVAVTPDKLVLAEIKSERDSLERLDRQTKNFARVTPDVRVYGAAKHRDGLLSAASCFVQAVDGRWSRNPVFVEDLEGREVRRAVCSALRRRPFPRADAPIGGAS